MNKSMGKRLVAVLVVAALVACAGTLLGASDRVFKITAPANGATVQGTVVVRVLAKGLDNLAYVIFGVDETRPCSSNSLPYRYSLDTAALGNGPHTLSAWGFSHYGVVASASPITVVVANSAASPAAPSAPAPLVLGPPQLAPAQAPMPKPNASSQPADAAPSAAPAPMSAETPAAPATEQTAPPAITASSLTIAAIATAQPAAAAPAAPAEPAKWAAPAVALAPEKPGHLTVTVDGAPLACEVAPAMRVGIAYGPLRGIIERIGGRLGWDNVAKRATADTAQVRLALTVGSAKALVNDKPVSMAGPVWLEQGRTMAPVRSCAEALRLRVAWQPQEMMIALFSRAPSREVGMLPK